MVSLVDIIDVKRTVIIRGQEIEVEGINAEKLALLINAYPVLRLAFAGRGAEMSADIIIALGPDIAASIIAAAIGKCGDEKEEAAAAKLTIGEQLALLATIIEMSFPDGFGPFVERLRSLGLIESEAGGSGWVPGTNSQKPSSPSQTVAATGGAQPS